MDSHENQLPSSSSSSENMSSIDGCAISRPIRNSPESIGSSFDGESIGGNGATGGDIESIDSPLGHFKTDIFDAEYRMDYPGTHLDCQTDAAITIAQPADRTQSIPIWADFLISYSTVEGYFSYRNTSSGGWFVQSLGPLL
ncbi:caspase-3-like [Panonychus citri]|uniref:caspase-3-like n=1 Tax=Panonychus citri TaxID=50023 RepID=UPI00230709F6|nr:caspase-3-like [Panonychus citri]